MPGIDRALSEEEYMEFCELLHNLVDPLLEKGYSYEEVQEYVNGEMDKVCK